MGSRIDILGRQFGLWTVTKGPTRTAKNGSLYWLCRCRGCDKETEVLGHTLRDGHSLGCPSCRSKHPYENKPKRDLSGQVFGRLTARSPVKVTYSGQGRWAWLCSCECGNKSTVPSDALLNKKVQSCGCLKRGQRGSAHPLWKGFGEISGHHWAVIKTNAEKRNLKFDLSIKEAWEIFLSQDRLCALSGTPITFGVGNAYQGKKLFDSTTASLDRINSRDSYSPENCQ